MTGIGVAGMAGLAGCGGGSGEGSPTGDESSTDMDDSDSDSDDSMTETAFDYPDGSDAVSDATVEGPLSPLATGPLLLRRQAGGRPRSPCPRDPAPTGRGGGRRSGRD